MREIEFKAQMVDDGVWVYGFLSDIEEITVHVEDDSVGFYTSDAYKVIPETVCQFIGLKDKNGVKIFEGDKFQYRKHGGYFFDDFIGIVSFWDGCFGFTVIPDTKTGCLISFGRLIPFSKFDELQEDFLNHIEIIGNIHDKAQQKQAIIDMMRGDEELGLYDE